MFTENRAVSGKIYCKDYQSLEKLIQRVEKEQKLAKFLPHLQDTAIEIAAHNRMTVGKFLYYGKLIDFDRTKIKCQK